MLQFFEDIVKDLCGDIFGGWWVYEMYGIWTLSFVVTRIFLMGFVIFMKVADFLICGDFEVGSSIIFWWGFLAVGDFWLE